MRIRKRFPPPSLSSVPLSDPQLSRSLVVQPRIQEHLHGNLVLQEEVKTNPHLSDPHNQPFQLPTSQEMMIGTQNPILPYPANSTQEQEIKGKEIRDERWKTEEEEMKISNDISLLVDFSGILRKESISSAEEGMQFPKSSSSSCQAFDRLGERERIVPPKKRKGSFERMGSKEMIKPKMKSKTNKKCQQENGLDLDHDHHDHEKKVKTLKDGSGVDQTKNTTSSSTKKSKRGNVIMEGSRCSRVNGRGWRCCQQTLVGYSLCEHHLGKGRLRSMSSVRSRSNMAHNMSNITTTTTIAAAAAAENDDDQNYKNINETSRSTQTQEIQTNNNNNNIGGHGEDERRPILMVSRKKRMMKIGAVKARSISSLLGQTDRQCS